MEISDIVYLAFATVVVIVVLHIGVFWVSRLIQAPQPKIVYVDRTPLPAIIPQAPPMVVEAPLPPQVILPPRVEPPPPVVQSQQTASVPTYAALPPPVVQSMKQDQLPPPIDTREIDKVGWSGASGGAPAK